MYWNYTKPTAQWWLIQEDDDTLCAYIEQKRSLYICFLLRTNIMPWDAEFSTLEEATAWCEAMCALEAK